MQIAEARELIASNRLAKDHPQIWADLGCGTGTFTLALAELLPAGSMIHAIDTDKQSLDKIPGNHKEIRIDKHVCDFITDSLHLNHLDGILMANALHYVKDKPAFIDTTKRIIKASGCFLIVEYDTLTAHQWVPYPIDFISLHKLFNNAGFDSIVKLYERPSVYSRMTMYSAIIEKL
jgi:ubiquinone/menaquinone biosynthesis C-methylase UbiE